jgi:alpha-glucosidase (family GH31 glycosyl hydrolase)
MEAYRSFTYDTDRYAGLPQFVDQLHANNMHYVPILDAGVSARPWGNYAAYDSGVAQDLFVKASTDTDFIGNVWPNEAVYPDWYNPATSSWFVNNL